MVGAGVFISIFDANPADIRASFSPRLSRLNIRPVLLPVRRSIPSTNEQPKASDQFSIEEMFRSSLVWSIIQDGRGIRLTRSRRLYILT